MRRPGVALLEAIVALALLSMVGLAGLGLTRSAAGATALGRQAEQDLRDADDFLNAVSLWSRMELDQRLGTREQGRWQLSIERRASTLYLVRILDSFGASVILQTALFRREGLDATR